MKLIQKLALTMILQKLHLYILEGLGGKENIVSIDNCVTRLRLEIKDNL